MCGIQFDLEQALLISKLRCNPPAICYGGGEKHIHSKGYACIESMEDEGNRALLALKMKYRAVHTPKNTRSVVNSNCASIVEEQLMTTLRILCLEAL